MQRELSPEQLSVREFLRTRKAELWNFLDRNVDNMNSLAEAKQTIVKLEFKVRDQESELERLRNIVYERKEEKGESAQMDEAALKIIQDSLLDMKESLRAEQRSLQDQLTITVKENAELKVRLEEQINLRKVAEKQLADSLSKFSHELQQTKDDVQHSIAEAVEKMTRALPFLINAEPRVDFESLEELRTTALNMPAKPEETEVDWKLLSFIMDLASMAGVKAVADLVKHMARICKSTPEKFTDSRKILMDLFERLKGMEEDEKRREFVRNWLNVNEAYYETLCVITEPRKQLEPLLLCEFGNAFFKQEKKQEWLDNLVGFPWNLSDAPWAQEVSKSLVTSEFSDLSWRLANLVKIYARKETVEFYTALWRALSSRQVISVEFLIESVPVENIEERAKCFCELVRGDKGLLFAELEVILQLESPANIRQIVIDLLQLETGLQPRAVGGAGRLAFSVIANRPTYWEVVKAVIRKLVRLGAEAEEYDVAKTLFKLLLETDIGVVLDESKTMLESDLPFLHTAKFHNQIIDFSKGDRESMQPPFQAAIAILSRKEADHVQDLLTIIEKLDKSVEPTVRVSQLFSKLTSENNDIALKFYWNLLVLIEKEASLLEEFVGLMLECKDVPFLLSVAQFFLFTNDTERGRGLKISAHFLKTEVEEAAQVVEKVNQIYTEANALRSALLVLTELHVKFSRSETKAAWVKYLDLLRRDKLIPDLMNKLFNDISTSPASIFALNCWAKLRETLEGDASQNLAAAIMFAMDLLDQLSKNTETQKVFEPALIHFYDPNNRDKAYLHILCENLDFWKEVANLRVSEAEQLLSLLNTHHTKGHFTTAIILTRLVKGLENAAVQRVIQAISPYFGTADPLGNLLTKLQAVQLHPKVSTLLPDFLEAHCGEFVQNVSVLRLYLLLAKKLEGTENLNENLEILCKAFSADNMPDLTASDKSLTLVDVLLHLSTFNIDTNYVIALTKAVRQNLQWLNVFQNLLESLKKQRETDAANALLTALLEMLCSDGLEYDLPLKVLELWMNSIRRLPEDLRPFNCAIYLLSDLKKFAGLLSVLSDIISAELGLHSAAFTLWDISRRVSQTDEFLVECLEALKTIPKDAEGCVVELINKAAATQMSPEELACYVRIALELCKRKPTAATKFLQGLLPLLNKDSSLNFVKKLATVSFEHAIIQAEIACGHENSSVFELQTDLVSLISDIEKAGAEFPMFTEAMKTTILQQPDALKRLVVCANDMLEKNQGLASLAAKLILSGQSKEAIEVLCYVSKLAKSLIDLVDVNATNAVCENMIRSLNTEMDTLMKIKDKDSEAVAGKIAEEVNRQRPVSVRDIWRLLAPRLVNVQAGGIRLFDFDTKTWGPKAAIQGKVSIDNNSSYTFLPTNSVFCCGGG